jgi:hypothetical protein
MDTFISPPALPNVRNLNVKTHKRRSLFPIIHTIYLDGPKRTLARILLSLLSLFENRVQLYDLKQDITKALLGSDYLRK